MSNPNQRTPFVLTRESEYLKSVVDPTNGPVSNPDDKIVRHTLRQETVTASVPVPVSGVGLFVVYPLTTDRKRVFHYVCTDPLNNQWVLQDTVTQAQDLSDNYNLARLTASKLVIESNTISTTEAVLSGTVNAVHYEAGGLSELNINASASSDQLYSSLLASTSNDLDKEGQIRLSEGVTVVGLPNDASTPYDRLPDKTPTTTADVPIVSATYADSEHSTKVLVNGPNFDYVMTQGASRVLHIFNADLGTSSGSITTSFATTQTSSIGFSYELLNCFGNVIGSAAPFEASAAFSPNPNNDTAQRDITTIIPAQAEPVCAIRVKARFYGTGTPPRLTGIRHSLTIDKGKMYGFVSPVTLVMYTGVTTDVSVSLRGHLNYELVPNPNLLKQMRTYYGPYDKEEFEYVKMVLANREELGLKTVIRSSLYGRMRARVFNVADVSAPINATAEAGGFGTLMKGLKSFGPPVLSAIMKANGTMANAAGGTAYADERTPTAKMAAQARSTIRTRPEPALSEDEYEVTPTQSPARLRDPFGIIVGSGDLDSADKGAAFPTILTVGDDVIGFKMFVILSGDYSDQLPGGGQQFVYSRSGPSRVFGTGLGGPKLPFDLDTDYTIFGLEKTDLTGDYILTGTVFCETISPPISGNSWYAACAALVARGPERGFLPAAITGSTNKPKSGEFPMQLPNAAFPLKNEWCQSLGIELYGASNGRPFRLYSTPSPLESPTLALNFPYPTYAPNQRANAMDRVGAAVADVIKTEEEEDGYVNDLEKAAQEDEELAKDLDDDPELKRELLASAAAKRAEVAKAVIKRRTITKPARLPAAAPPSLQDVKIAAEIKNANRPYSKLDILESIKDIKEFPDQTAEVLEWVLNNGLIPSLARMMASDPNGIVTHRVLKPHTEMFDYGEGRISNAAAQYKRAVVKAANLATQYDGITAEWVMANGARGPDSTQVMYYQKFGVLPQPGDMSTQGSLALRPADREAAVVAQHSGNFTGTGKLQNKIANILKSDVGATPWLASELNEYVARYGKIPPTDELMAMKRADPERDIVKAEHVQARNMAPRITAATITLDEALKMSKTKAALPVSGAGNPRASRMMTLMTAQRANRKTDTV